MLTRPQMTRNCLFGFMQFPLQFNNLEHNGICQQSEGRMHGNKHWRFLVLSNASSLLCWTFSFACLKSYFRLCAGILFIIADYFILLLDLNLDSFLTARELEMHPICCHCLVALRRHWDKCDYFRTILIFLSHNFKLRLTIDHSQTA